MQESYATISLQDLQLRAEGRKYGQHQADIGKEVGIYAKPQLVPDMGILDVLAPQPHPYMVHVPENWKIGFNLFLWFHVELSEPHKKTRVGPGMRELAASTLL